jgi:uncharacterized protein YkwD
MRAVAPIAAIASALVLVGVSSASPNELAPQGECAASGPSTAAKHSVLLCLVNWARAANGAGALSPSSQLGEAATGKGSAIVSCGDFSHTPCGADALAPVQRAGYPFRLWGENLYWGSGPFASARSAVKGWLRSPGHRQAMLDRRFREIGIAAISWPRRGTVWVIELGRR